MEQEKIMQIQMMEQEVNQLNEQLGLIEQNVGEMNGLMESLNEIDKKDSKEILANLGKKIYIPVEIKEKKLIVDVGKNNLVRKSVPETKKIVEDQIGKLVDVKGQIMSRLNDLQGQMNDMIVEIQKSQMEKKD